MKKWIILLAVMILFMTSILIILLFYQNDTEKDEKVNIVENEGIVLPQLNETLQVVNNRNDFYIVQNCISKFYIYYAEMFELEDEDLLENAQEIKKQNALTVYDILDSEYISENGITKENIVQKLSNIKKSTVNVEKMYVSEKTNNINIYVANGTLIETKTKETSSFQVIVKLDLINKSFCIIPQDYVEERYKDLETGNNIEIYVPEEIEKNNNNGYDYRVISDEDYIVDIFSQYQDNVLYNVEKAYLYLDKDYSEKRFGDITNYNQYVKDNYIKIFMLDLDKYLKEVKEDYTQYTCIDTNGQYYIFRETAPMQYTVILDTYTIDLPEVLEKYETATNEEKVLLNIQKFFEAINNTDYKYAYSKLDETFKINNFATLEDFKKYVKSNFFEQNKLSASNPEKQGDIYLYDITISDNSGKSTTNIKKTFVMQLKEETEFVMSFEVQ